MSSEVHPPAVRVLKESRLHQMLALGLLGCGAGVVINGWVRVQGRAGISSRETRFHLEEKEQGEVAAVEKKTIVVLGSPPSSSGKPTPTLHQRLLTAAIVAARNPTWTLCITGVGFGPKAETPLMKSVLLDEGVAKNRILVDSHSLRTFDSVSRMAAYNAQARPDGCLDVPELVFVSQRFHVERAVYLARALGLKATGIPCAGRNGKAKDRIREYGARVRAFVDVHGQMPPSYSIADFPFDS